MKALIFLFLCSSFVFFPALAGQMNNVTINTIVVDEHGMVRLTLSGGTEVSPKAGCSSSTTNNAFIYDFNSTAGKAWHSLALSAQATQKKVHVVGTNSCLNLWASKPYESIKSIYLIN